jgi:hypothetical protein
MEDIAGANEPPELKKTWPANHAERKYAVVVISRGSLRHQGDFELSRAICIEQFDKSSGQRKNDGFHAADARSEKVGVD